MPRLQRGNILQQLAPNLLQRGFRSKEVTSQDLQFYSKVLIKSALSDDYLSRLYCQTGFAIGNTEALNEELRIMMKMDDGKIKFDLIKSHNLVIFKFCNSH